MNNYLLSFQKEPVVEYNNKVGATPLVSVCIQTFQHVDFIVDCIKGVIIQKTNFLFEILIGEDASTDGTRELCVQYAKEYPQQIRLFLHSNRNKIRINGNPTGRFNFLYNLSQARGKYIAFCEGDDYWTDPYKLQKQVDFLEGNEEYSICFHPVKIEKNGELFDDYITKEVPDSTTIYDLAQGNYIHTPTVVFKNRTKEQFSSSLLFKSPVGDYVLHMLNSQYGKIKIINDIMAVYRVHETGIWGHTKKSNRLLKWLTVLQLLINHFSEKDDQKLIITLKEQYLKRVRELYKAMTKENHTIEDINKSFRTIAKEYSEVFADYFIMNEKLLESKDKGNFFSRAYSKFKFLFK